MQLNRQVLASALLLVAGLAVMPAWAVVLPEDRFDAMYHYYDGGGTEVHGPALLVRKSFAEQASIYASYYTDTISGASIDIVTTASPYKEKRDEIGVGVDFLRRNTTMSVSYTTSDERDYLSTAFGINIAHEVFDGLSTLSLGYLIGSDQVKKVGTSFQEPIDRYHYKLGWSQVFTRSFLMSLEYEGILEEGYLSSPYRAARLQGLLVPEIYPNTRDSYAVALRAKKGFGSNEGPLGSSLNLGYRYFTDTWDVRAHTIDVGYQKRLGARWIVEPRYRYYQQSAASFYSDNFASSMSFMARDKELSTFKSHSLGVKASWSTERTTMRSAVTGSFDILDFRYDDFTDMRSAEPYSFKAYVAQLMWSLWY